MERVDILALFLHFLMLSGLTIGGTQTVMPDMYRYLVEVNGWITPKQFTDAYALAQAAPGPNVMYVTLLGWQVAGWMGALATMLGIIIPSTIMTLTFARAVASYPDTPLVRAIRRGLAPVAIGLTFASGWILMQSINHDWRGYLITALTGAIVLRTQVNPLWLVAAGTIAGAAGLA
jgi:chromate transporter